MGLKFLATYKFLTSSQLVALGMYKHRGDVTKALKELQQAKNPLVWSKRFQANLAHGKPEYIYYLTQYGKNYLLKNLDYNSSEIKYAKKDVELFRDDYKHRKQTVNFYIGLNQWIIEEDGEIIFGNYYFEKIGNNRVKDKKKHVYSLNRFELKNGEAFTPDLITMFTINNREYLFIFEQHNSKSISRLVKQLKNRLYAILEGVFEEQLGFKRSPRIAVVFENENLKYNAMKRLRQDQQFDSFYNFFIFKTNDELQKNFNHNWSLLDGQKVSFIQPRKTN